MKFVYQYRTSDNKSHKGMISAASRDAAFAALRAQGIKAGRVEEAPGFFNKLFGKGKRWIAIAVLGLTAIAAVLVAHNTERKVRQNVNGATSRHHIYGDPALLSRLERNGYADVFTHEGDRALAAFAQPGSIGRLSYHLQHRMEAIGAIKKLVGDLAEGRAPLTVGTDDEREVRECKQIVLGMRGELLRYLSNGVGTVETYVRRLEERQAREQNIYQAAKRDLEKVKDQKVWEERNESLRVLGLPTIVGPESW